MCRRVHDVALAQLLCYAVLREFELVPAPSRIEAANQQVRPIQVFVSCSGGRI